MYRISKYHIGQQDAENLMKTVSLQRKGLMLVTLTNFENTSAPEIARGSICDVANTLFESAGESILGTAVEGMNYIKLIPTSDDNIAAYYTQSAPTWNAELGGWYGVGESANHRYIAGFSLSGSSFSNKFLLTDRLSLYNRYYGTGGYYGTGVFYQDEKIVTPLASIDHIVADRMDCARTSGYHDVSLEANQVFTIFKPTTIILPSYSTPPPYPVDYTVTVEYRSLKSHSSSLYWHQFNDPSSPIRSMSLNPGEYRIDGTCTIKVCGGYGYIDGAALSAILDK